ncbi:MAG: class I SAM-dependent methyltransferase [Anaerolineales bacterium]|nr:class I SAM-dependent methyltransferase [Anaerolineales bacterium]
MIGGDTPELIEIYNRIGRGAFQLTLDGIQVAGRTLDDIQSLLDYGCGYGRVTRVFAQNLSPKNISVFDVDADASRFCAEEFGVKSLVFHEGWNWKSVGFEKYDCIWVGSVFTHLSESYTKETMELLISLLNPGGILVFTTHGEEALRRTDWPDWFGATIYNKRKQIQTNFKENNFYFLPYSSEELGILPFEFKRGADFGVTWMSESYTRNLLARLSNGRLMVREFRSAGWEGYQDAFFCQYS